MTLGGWQRLWVVLSTAYLLVVTAIAVITLPDMQALVETDIRGEMPRDSVNVLDRRIPRVGEDVTALVNGAPEAQPPVRVHVEGRVLEFLAGTPEPLMEAVANDYYVASTVILRKDRQRHVLVAAVSWAAPCVLLYILGMSIAWIRAGFKGNG